MTSKRQLGHHDDTVQTDAKRRHLEPSPGLTSAGFCGGIHAPVASEIGQLGNRNETGGMTIRSHHVRHSGSKTDGAEQTKDSSNACGIMYDGFVTHHMDIDPSRESTAVQRVCFGTVCLLPISCSKNVNVHAIFTQLCEVQAKLMFYLDTSAEPRSKTGRDQGTRAARFRLFNIELRDGICGFVVPDSNTFIMVDLITSKKLEALQHTTVCTKAVIEGQTLDQLVSKRNMKRQFAISLNLYGSESDAHDIGRRLAKVGAFLQHPFYVEDGIEYLNPQFFSFRDGPRYLTHLVGISESELQAKILSDSVQDVLTSLDHGIHAVTTDGPGIMTSDDLITPLKEY